MVAAGELSEERLRASLGTWLCPGADAVEVKGVTDLSGGLGGSRVFRVVACCPPEPSASVVLKIPDWGGPSLVAPGDPLVSTREVHFYQSDLPARLPDGLSVPEVFAVEPQETTTWIWMRDLGPQFAVDWDRDRALEAGRRCALLYELYRSAEPELRRLEWLGRDEYATYAHHIPRCHQNLEKIRAQPAWAWLLTPRETERLHRALRLLGWAREQLVHLPVTLAHGDFHTRNLGWSPDGALIVVDWAHLGIGPLGADPATFYSLYRLFSGDVEVEDVAEQEFLDAYCAGVAAVSGQDFGAEVRRAAGLWHLTWGLHLRLGPGLTAVLDGLISDPGERARAVRDIQEGCRRALAFLDAD